MNDLFYELLEQVDGFIANGKKDFQEKRKHGVKYLSPDRSLYIPKKNLKRFTKGMKQINRTMLEVQHYEAFTKHGAFIAWSPTEFKSKAKDGIDYACNEIGVCIPVGKVKEFYKDLEKLKSSFF